ncbi:hypothetical protein QFC20_003817 [Naganishia adeliensis]|uniref:Uncharacterized protein n=1 Tax=Naganishia adeliensis TaxID=92952 RepID=A0ACC2W646_9TREE|nr:hypothetical protein QFC20_003817 [Naganishia adeliensis]
MGSTTSTPQNIRLEQPPGLEELDPSLLEHERLRERSFSVHARRDGPTTRDGEKIKATRWDRFVQEGARRVLNFTPSWFSVNMGTGITSILLYTLPFQFHGLKTIATVIFFLNLVLFLLFLAMSLSVLSPPQFSPEVPGYSRGKRELRLRYTIWTGVWRKMVLHPQQSLFLGTFPMGFATLVNMVAFLTLDPGNDLRSKGFIAHDQHPQDVTGAWLLPPIANIVCSASGAIVAGYMDDRRAVITVIVSYILWGIGFGPTLLIKALYFNRLAMYNVPANTVIVSSFIPLGPCGQGAFAILRLSAVVRTLCHRRAAEGGTSLYTGEEWRMFGSAVYAGTVPVALTIWGFGFVWPIIAISSILNIRTRGEKIPFNMGWWGFTFPIGVFTSATLQFGTELDSVAFRVLGTIFTVTLVILWLTVAVGTAVKAWNGVIFMAPCLDDGGCVPVQSRRVLTKPAEALPVT